MNTLAQAHQKEVETLTALANVGWMTTRQIAEWGWPESPIKSGINKAQQVTKRLLDRGYLLRRETPTGITAWVLTRGGAEYLNRELLASGYSRGWANAGYDLSTRQPLRHGMVLNYLTKARHDGLAAVGKAGIRAGLVNERLDVFDGVVVNLSNTHVTGVVFVNNCRPQTHLRLQRLAPLCTSLALVGPQDIITRLSR